MLKQRLREIRITWRALRLILIRSPSNLGRSAVQYHEIKGYPDKSMEKNLEAEGINPHTAKFTLTSVPIELVGYYVRDNHETHSAARVEKFIEAFSRGNHDIPPIITIPTGKGTYGVPDGYHRLHAMRALNKPYVDTYVVTAD